MSILSVNAGSSTIKFALFDVHDGKIGAMTLNGNMQGLEPNGNPTYTVKNDKGVHKEGSLEVKDGKPFNAALVYIKELLDRYCADSPLQAITHRVVHGGRHYNKSVLVDDKVIQDLLALHPLAPLHEKHNVAGIQVFKEFFPDVPQVACFDTAFHSHNDEIDTTFAIPLKWRDEEGIRRYGFHGLSYQFISEQLQKVSTRALGRVVMCHLGNGSSVCAMRKGVGVTSSMGFTALDGLMMGSRCGNLDAGVVLHMISKGMTYEEIEKLLYKQSGLLGVSGISADVRTLREKGTPEALFAIKLYVQRAKREIGALFAVLNGIDVISFSAGIGENDAQIREDICEGLSGFGIHIDKEKNKNVPNHCVSYAIHEPESRAEIWVIHTDEGHVAASDALALVMNK